MIKARSFGTIILIAACSFSGGIVGGWMAQSGFLTNNAKATQGEVVENLHVKNLTADKLVVNFVASAESRSGSYSVLDKNFKPVVEIYPNNGNGGTIDMRRSDNTGAADIRLGATQESASLSFKDIDGDHRVGLGQANRQPYLEFLYNGKSRLVLGTNNIETIKTGDSHEVVGSVCTFDKDGKVTFQAPR